MTDYILDGWGNKDLWILNNAIWEIFGEEDCLKTGNNISVGSGVREVNALNRDWKFKIAYTIKVTPEEMRCAEIDFFLEGDSKPIEFHHSKDEPDVGYQTFFIIYDGYIKASKTIPMEETDYTTEIYRIGSVYYYTSYGLSFDYGSVKKPVRLRLAGHLYNYLSHWWNLQWYYIAIEEDYAFVT